VNYTPSIHDRDQYVIFLQEAIQQWHDAGLQVSMTTMFNPEVTFVVSQVYQQIDRFHVMTYDLFIRNASDDNDPYHASLAKTMAILEAWLQPFADEGISRTGHTPEKFLLGIPVYARQLQNPGNVMTFGEIYDAIQKEKGNDEQSIDWNSLHSWNGFEWESGQRIRDKVELAKSKGLGGIYFWEVGQDKVNYEHPRGLFLETTAASVRNKIATDNLPLRGDGDEL
jgi:GH18 family chitinase